MCFRDSTAKHDKLSDIDHNYESVKDIKKLHSDESKPTEDIEMASCVAYGEVTTGAERDKGEIITVYETVN